MQRVFRNALRGGLVWLIVFVSASTGVDASQWDASGAPVFTAAQAIAGNKIYREACQSCHGTELQGKAGPSLVGSAFLAKWSTEDKTLHDLFGFIKTQMPLGTPGSLSTEQNIDLVAYLLSQNGYAAGKVRLGQQNLGVSMGPPIHRLRPRVPSVPGTVAQATTSRPDDSEVANPRDTDWIAHNHTLDGQRYSSLDQITVGNVGTLTVSCIFQLGEVGAFQMNPLVYDGIMYIASPYNTYAINPRNCEKIWESDYPAENLSTPIKVTRGIALYRGKLFRVTPNGHFLSIDAKTGGLLWDVLLADIQHGYWLSAAPVAYDGKVFIGEAGADWGANAHIFALDTETGEVRWKFNVIPTGNEPGAESWAKGAERGGGASWSTYTLQIKEGYLYVPVGNPAPTLYGAMRPGDNLFTDSVVALDYRTGKLAWYVQQVPHDVHDWDTAAAPVVYDHDGKFYMAVANKGGWLYIYDRASHKLVTQQQTTTILNADSPITSAGTHFCPGNQGGVEWNGPAYSPRDGLLFVNSVDWCATGTLAEDRYVEGLIYFDGNLKLDPPDQAKGWTKAFDAATGKPAWSRHSDAPMLAALTPTAGGIVFTGDLNGYFLALDSKTGDTRYRFNTGGAIAGAPATYTVDGKQFVAITSGNSSRSIWNVTGGMTVVIFSLPEH